MINLNQILAQFELQATVAIDAGRLEADPNWQMVRSHHDCSAPEGMEAALTDYLVRYLSAERVLADMPSTNGPAAPTGIIVRIGSLHKELS